jgi:acetylornithine deacetylase/succinyl-diaminopimelate desuccinylase-like protein
MGVLRFGRLAGGAVIAAACLRGPHASGQELTPAEREAREIFRELIEADTTHDHGATTPSAEAMARRLRDAGFPPADALVVGPAGSPNHNLVARLRGTGRRPPILWLAHLDVVEARREDWSLDPFRLTERDGFFYGRGSYDVKGGAAILVATFVRLKREGYRPDRDLVLALTADEERTGDYPGAENGLDWLLKERRSDVETAYCVNMDGGDPQIRKGKRVARTVQASEKVVQSFRLEATSPGGHSSLPTPDNPISRLAAGLARLAAYEFPARLNEVTRAYFEEMASLTPEPAAADMRAVARIPADPDAVARLSVSPFYNAQMRTTCVATLIEGGHAENALPQRARATVNCRMLPDEVPSQVEAAIRRVLADDRIDVAVIRPPYPSPASPLLPEVMQAVERTTGALWPGIPVVPVMETGATDGRFLRGQGIATYGVSGIFIDIDDTRAHGRDERIGVKDFYEGLEFIDRLVRALSGG